jgi:hypothetical protein
MADEPTQPTPAEPSPQSAIISPDEVNALTNRSYTAAQQQGLADWRSHSTWGDVPEDIGRGIQQGAERFGKSTSSLLLHAANLFGADIQNIDTPEEETPTRSFTGGVTSFMTQLALSHKAFGKPTEAALTDLAGTGGAVGSAARGALNATTAGAKAGFAEKTAKTFLKESASIFTAFDGMHDRLADELVKSNNPLLNNALSRFLASDPSDSWATARFKNAMEQAGAGVAMHWVLEGLGTAWRAAKAARARGDASAVVKHVNDAQEWMLQSKRMDELREQVRSAAPDIADAQISKAFSFYLAAGKSGGKTFEKTLDQIEKIVSHTGEDIGVLKQHIGNNAGALDEVFANAAKDHKLKHFGDVVVPEEKPLLDPSAEASNPPKTAADFQGSEVHPDAELSNPDSKKPELSFDSPEVQDAPEAKPIDPNAEATNVREPGVIDNSAAAVIDPRAELSNPMSEGYTTLGYTKFVNDAQAVIGLFSKANFSTLSEELFHVNRRFNLSSRVEKVLREAAGLNPGEAWSAAAEETAAQQWLKYLLDGTSRNPEVAKHFEDTRKWMTDIYKSVDRPEIATSISPEVRDAFESLISAGSSDKFNGIGGSAAQVLKQSIAPQHERAIRSAAAGELESVSPEEFHAQYEKNPGSPTLTHYSVEDLQKMKLFRLKNSDVYYALNPVTEHWATGKPEVDLVSVMNNGKNTPGVATPATMLHGVENGATILDAYDVRKPGQSTGFLPDRYSRFGFKEVGRSQFDPKYIDSPEKLKALEDFWKKSGWVPETGPDGSISNYPDVVVMKYGGDEASRQTLRSKYLANAGRLAGNGNGSASGGAAEAQADSFTKDYAKLLGGNSSTLAQKVKLSKVVKDNLTPEQQALIKSQQSADKIEAALKTELPTTKEMTALAKAGESVKGQYDQYSKLMVGMFGEEDGKQIALLNSAFSAQQEVGRHLADALRMFRIWRDAGRPRDEAGVASVWKEFLKDDRGAIARDTSHKPNVFSVLANPDPSSINGGRFSKSANFARNQMGDLSVGTFDTHMAKTTSPINAAELTNPNEILAIQKQWVSNPSNYLAFQARTAEVAKKLGWSVAEVQEAAWSSVISIARLKRMTKASTEEIIDNLRHDVVKQAWNSVQTFKGNADVRKQLETLGLEAGVSSDLANERGIFSPIETSKLSGPAVSASDRKAAVGVASRIAPSSGLTGRHLDLNAGRTPDYLFQRTGSVNPVPADIRTKVADDFADAVRSGKEYTDALDDVLVPINMRRVGVDNDIKPALKTLEDDLVSTYESRLGKVKTNKVTEAEAKNLAEILGTGEDAIKEMQKVGAISKPLAVRATVIRKVYAKIVTDAQQLAKQAIDSPELSGAYRDAVAKMTQAGVYRKEASTGIARALQSFNIVASPEEALSSKVLDNVEKMIVRGNAGPVDQRKFMRALAMAADDRAVTTVLKSFDDMWTKTGSKVADIHSELWINGLLSGMRTQVTNVVSQSGMTLLQPAFRILGGEVSSGFRVYANLLHTFNDMFEIGAHGLRVNPDGALSPAMKAFWNENPILMASTKLDRIGKAITAENFGIKDGTIGAHFMNWMGNAIRLPTRFLTSADELFKQVNYRAYLREEAYRDAMQRNILPGSQAFADHVDAYVRDGFTELGQGTDDLALKMAKRATFTQDFVEGSLMDTISGAVSKHPVLRATIPFVKVPTNIAKTVRDFTPGINLMFKEFRNEFFHVDPVIAADARGRAAAGVAFWSIAVGGAMSGKFTGGGPEDRKQRDALMATGWRPYSIVTENSDGSKSYIEYRRLEPFGMLLGLAADFTDVSAHADENTMDKTAIALTTAVAKNLTSRTYLQSLSETLKMFTGTEEERKRAMQSRLGSYIPNALSQVNTMDDEPLKEARTFMDGVIRRIPGYDESLPPKRDLLGEAVLTPPGWAPWGHGGPFENMVSPLRYSTRVGDPVKEEIAKLQYGFSLAPKQYQGIDMTNVRNGTKQDAYDRWQELHGKVRVSGKTLPDALTQLFESPHYKSLPEPRSAGDDMNGRVRAVQEVIGRYREAAARQTISEYPQFKELKKQLQQTKHEEQTPRNGVSILERLQK